MRQETESLPLHIVDRPLRREALHQGICKQLKADAINPSSQLVPPPREPLQAAGSSRVLVVDDNAQNRKLMRALLSGLNTCVVDADSGAAALSMEGSFDLIFMDVEMPDMDGLAATRAWRAREAPHRTPIVAVTAHDAAEKRAELLLDGMDDFIAKPVQESDLKTALERWLIAPGRGSRSLDARTAGGRNDPTSSPSALPSAVTALGSAQQSNIEDTDEAFVNERAAKEAAENSAGSAFAPTGAVFSLRESLQLCNNNAALALDMITMLLESLAETRADLQAAPNCASLREIAHKLHGGACYCGVPQLRAAAKALETAAAAGSPTEALLEQLLQTMTELEAWADNMDLQSLFLD